MNLNVTCSLLLLLGCLSLPLLSQPVKTVEFTYDDAGTQRTASFQVEIQVNQKPVSPHQRQEIKISRDKPNSLWVKISNLDWGGGQSYSLTFIGSGNKVQFDQKTLERQGGPKKIGSSGTLYFGIIDEGNSYVELHFGLEKGNVNKVNDVASFRSEFAFKYEGSTAVTENTKPPVDENKKPPKTDQTPPPQPRPASEPASRCMQVRNASSNVVIEGYLADYPEGNCAKEARELLQSWKELQGVSDSEQLVEWNQKYPDSQFGDQAEELMVQLSPMTANWTDFENQFEVEISNFVRPTINRIEGWNDQFFSIDSSQLARNGKFTIKIEEGANVIVYIQDLGKSNNNRLPINLSNKLNVDVDSTGGNAYAFTFQGGEAPFLVEVRQNNRTVHRKRADSGNKVVLTKAELLALGLTGSMEIIARSAYSYTDELPAIFVEDSSLPVPMELLALIGVLLLGLLIFLIMKSGQRRRKLKEQQEFQQNIHREKDEKSPVSSATATPKTTGSKPSELKTEEIAPTPPPREHKQEVNPPKKEGIVIRSVKKEALAEGQAEQPAFAELLNAGSFYKLDLTGLWADTSVLNVFMGKQPIRDIDIYLRSTTANEGKEQEGKIPEIGGFLMGQFEEKGLYYNIAITNFVAIEAANQNAYKLEFSTESMAMELSNVLDTHPHLKVVGWFHTHPGHGLFLSKPDLTIHEGFFLKRYQVAMEIDSLSENLDTAFFTRSVNGTINNVEDLNPGIDWFHWTEIEKSTRRRR